MRIDPSSAAAFNAMNEGILVIDRAGCIIFGNTTYQKFLRQELGDDLGNIEGRRLRELRPGARLPDVFLDGKPILHQTRKEIEDFYFVNMYPIYEGEELVGGISVITFLEDAYQTRSDLEALEARSRQVLHRINKANGAHYTFEDIVACCPAAVDTKTLAQKVADTDAPVLLEGESGVGKELYAQSIHNASSRRKGVFVAINCANFNSNMLESELFGYAEGAFTGAKKGGKIGLFEAAAGGTLFLDEISEMELSLQSKLLRVLQEKRIRPVGGVKEIEVDVRVVAACNVDLPRYIEEGKFRRDLYYRLSVFPIHILPLRQRREDIPALTEALLGALAKKLRRGFTVAPAAMDILQSHDWPGNVRELRNVLEFAGYLSRDGVINAADLPANLLAGTKSALVPLAEQVRDFQRQVIQERLKVNGDSLEGKQKTARELGISLASLYNKLK